LKNRKLQSIQRLFIPILIGLIIGCGQGGDDPQKIKAVPPAGSAATAPLTDTQAAPAAVPGAPAVQSGPLAAPQAVTPSTVIAQVDGTKMTRGQLDAEQKRALTAMADKIPPDRMAETTAKVRRQIVDDFVVRTLLGGEVKKQKITVTEQEITDALADMKKTIPQGTTMEEMLKKNGMTLEKLREEVSLGLRINKLIAMQPESKVKPTEKEVSAFYKANRSKFKVPETAHARHILIAKAQGDDENIRGTKKAKAEGLRKQLLGGADFAELAKANSDCPSKTSGGDLGTFAKGQMVKPFEDAAFKQKINEIGPIVETDFGYHIVQVLERKPSKIHALDKSLRTRIAGHLQQEKRYAGFNALMNRLKAKAAITVADQP